MNDDQLDALLAFFLYLGTSAVGAFGFILLLLG